MNAVQVVFRIFNQYTFSMAEFVEAFLGAEVVKWGVILVSVVALLRLFCFLRGVVEKGSLEVESFPLNRPIDNKELQESMRAKKVCVRYAQEAIPP